MGFFSSQRAWGRFAIVFGLGVLAGCGENDAPDDDLSAAHAPEIARIVPASEALAGAYVPTLDPARMNDAEIVKVLGAGPHCEFRYTSAGDSVLAWQAPPNGSAIGVVKLNGHLVILRSASNRSEFALVAEQIRVTIALDKERNVPAIQRQQETNVIFEVGSKLKAGYRGYYKCTE